MKLSELYKSVAQLGFEDSLEDDDRFFYAANRALLQVNKLRPAIGCYYINHKPLDNLVKEASFTPIEKEEEIIFEATGAKSYYFEADGNGVLYVEQYNTELDRWDVITSVELTSTRTFVPYRGFIKKEGKFVGGLVRLRFSGEYLYSIKNVAMYKHLYSDNVDDIPAYESYTRYNLSELVEDFLTFSCPPIFEGERNCILNQDYEIEGKSTIMLPYDKKGLYRVLYEKCPTLLVNKGDTPNDETLIDLDEEMCSLLPPLIAAYVWCDDEPTKAEYYMNLYRERVSELEHFKAATTPTQIRSVNGW